MKPLNELDGLEIKLRQLAVKLNRQRADHEVLVTENKQLKRELDHQLGVVSALKDKLERSQSMLASEGAFMQDIEAHRQQKEIIDFCLGEIDRCIDWLQRS